MLPTDDLATLDDLLRKAQQDLRRARAPKNLIDRLSDAHLAVEWLTARKKKQ